MDQPYVLAGTSSGDEIWRALFLRSSHNLEQQSARPFMQGLQALNLSEKCPTINEVDGFLRPLGWNVVESPSALLHRIQYFANQQFPISIHLRDKNHLDHSKIPDFFTHCFAQLPLMHHQEYRDLLSEFGRIAQLTVADPQTFQEWLLRLYWHALEKGVWDEGQRHFALGSQLLQSPVERAHCLTSEYKQYGTHPVMRTPFSTDKIPNFYYTFARFFDVRKCLLDFERMYKNT